MTINEITATAHIRKGAGRALKSGGAWIYDNEIEKLVGPYENGDIVKVEDFDGYPMGYGMINDISTIRIRMLTRNGREAGEDILTEEFFKARVQAAWDYRKVVLGVVETTTTFDQSCKADIVGTNPQSRNGDLADINLRSRNGDLVEAAHQSCSANLTQGDLQACRVIFGEADWLPGLVVDKYSDILVVECLSLGMDRLKKMILQHLIDCMQNDGYPIRAVYERSDAPVRRKEGMTPFKGLIYLNTNVCEETAGSLHTELNREALKHVELSAGKIIHGSSVDSSDSTESGQHTATNDSRLNELASLSWLSDDEITLQASPEGRVSVAKEHGFNPVVEIIENGVHYMVDVENGQKTGFFLDQKYNRLAMQRIVSGYVNAKLLEKRRLTLDVVNDVKRVQDTERNSSKALNSENDIDKKADKSDDTIKILDCFTHMGTFALNCGLAAKKTMEPGVSQTMEPRVSQTMEPRVSQTIEPSASQSLKPSASQPLKPSASQSLEPTASHAMAVETSVPISVTGLDISEYAVSQATANAELNGLSEIVKFRAANVLDELPRLYEAGEKYDILILDPPAFTKSREATKNAIKGYREINMKGLKLVKDGGYFATCSCSHFMTQELFTETIAQAAKAVHKRLRQIEFRTQAPDHPILWSADESYYLKFFIFQVVDER